MTTQKRGPGRPRKTEESVSEVSEQTTKRVRRKRVPMGGHISKLHVEESEKDPAYAYRWFRNVANRVNPALAAGFEYVTAKDAALSMPSLLAELNLNQGNQSVSGYVEKFGGTDQKGNEYNMVLMKQPKEFAEEDDALRTQKADQVDHAISRQEFSGQALENSYGDINVTVKQQE